MLRLVLSVKGVTFQVGHLHSEKLQEKDLE